MALKKGDAMTQQDIIFIDEEEVEITSASTISRSN